MKKHLKYLAERDVENARIAKEKEAKVKEDSDDDYYAGKMREHLKYLAERDVERRKGKNNEEEVRVIKMKEVPVFDEEVIAEKTPGICENCETVKKKTKQ
ncbi:hypothetical protein Hanom_Chr07g00582041 [Helianthus anomalus]